MDISNAIARGLRNKGMSQKDLAEKLDIGQSSIAKWVSGKAMPQADKMIEVIRLLDLVEEFFPGYGKLDKEKIGKEVLDIIHDSPEIKELQDKADRIDERYDEVLDRLKRMEEMMKKPVPDGLFDNLKMGEN